MRRARQDSRCERPVLIGQDRSVGLLAGVSSRQCGAPSRGAFSAYQRGPVRRQPARRGLLSCDLGDGMAAAGRGFNRLHAPAHPHAHLPHLGRGTDSYGRVRRTDARDLRPPKPQLRSGPSPIYVADHGHAHMAPGAPPPSDHGVGGPCSRGHLCGAERADVRRHHAAVCALDSASRSAPARPVCRQGICRMHAGLANPACVLEEPRMRAGRWLHA
eukprot:82471-Chlamydomonas_euryale.AAC.4